MTLIKPAEIAKILDRSLRWVYNNAYELGGIRIGGSWFFTKERFGSALSGQNQEWMARGGKTPTKEIHRSFPTKREAQEWEIATWAKLKKTESRLQSGMDLMTFCAKYLDHAKQYAAKTYDEKKILCRRILEEWGIDMPVEDITPAMAKDYLDQRAMDTSANAYNKDRKNLRAMWKWGEDFHDIKNNPLKKIKKRAHDVTPHYTPLISDNYNSRLTTIKIPVS